MKGSIPLTLLCTVNKKLQPVNRRRAANLALCLQHHSEINTQLWGLRHSTLNRMFNQNINHNINFNVITLFFMQICSINVKLFTIVKDYFVIIAHLCRCSWLNKDKKIVNPQLPVKTSFVNCICVFLFRIVTAGASQHAPGKNKQDK